MIVVIRYRMVCPKTDQCGLRTLYNLDWPGPGRPGTSFKSPAVMPNSSVFMRGGQVMVSLWRSHQWWRASDVQSVCWRDVSILLLLVSSMNWTSQARHMSVLNNSGAHIKVSGGSYYGRWHYADVCLDTGVTG